MEREIIEIEKKIRFTEEILNSFTKEQLVNYLTMKFVLGDCDLSDFPINLQIEDGISLFDKKKGDN